MKDAGTESDVNSTPKRSRKRQRGRRRGSLQGAGFTLFRRGGRGSWYFYIVRNGKRAAQSTHTSDYSKAMEAAREALEPKKREVTLDEFCADFFVWGRCPWIAAQHAAGRTFGRGAALGRRSHLTTWILPAFGQRTLGSITPRELRDWIIGLPLSGQSKNHVKYTLKIIFSEAVFAELIPHSPVDGIRNVALDVNERDPFDEADFALLFPAGAGRLREIWGDDELATLFLVVKECGLRSGEACALAWAHWRCRKWQGAKPGETVELHSLLVERSVKYGREIGPTKSGKPRPVYLPERARAALEAWRPVCPWNGPGDLIFPGEERGKPLGDQMMRDRLHRAMKAAGVDGRGRNLVPHSFRHSWVTRMKRVLPQDVLLLMAGHADAKTQRGYLHPSEDDWTADIVTARGLLEGPAK